MPNSKKSPLFFLLLQIRDGEQGNVRSWKLNDSITVHKLLETTLVDHDAASSKFVTIVLPSVFSYCTS